MIACDQLFGPRVNPLCRRFDFTLLFEDVVLACLPAAVFLALLPLCFYVLLKRPSMFKSSRLGPAKLLVIASIVLLQSVLLGLRHPVRALRTRASIAADTLGLVAAIGAAMLSWFNHHRSLRSSSILDIYLSASLLLDLPRVRTFASIHGARGPAVVLSLVLALLFIAIFLESVSKGRLLQSHNRHLTLGAEALSGLWKRIAYVWLLATVRLGYRQVLSVDSLPKLDPQLESRLLRKRIDETWKSGRRIGKHALLLACLRAHVPALIAAVIPRLCLSIFTYLQPFLINALTSWIEIQGPSDYGRGLIGAYALVYLGMAASTALYWYQTYRFLIRLRGSLLPLIYQQAIQVRAVDMGDLTGLTLMSTDIDRILQSFRSIHEVWASLLEMIVAVVLLERQLGVACLAPALLTTAFALMAVKLSMWSKASQRSWIEKVEKRLAVTSSMLGDLKVVKMLGLSDRMFEIIDRLHSTEVKASAAYRKNILVEIFLSNSPAVLAPVVTFAVYVGIASTSNDASLVASKAFTSLALVSILTSSSLMFIQGLPSIAMALGCFERIQNYCNLPAHPFYKLDETTDTIGELSAGSDISLRIMTRGSGPSNTDSNAVAVAFQNQSFSWQRSGPITLTALNFAIEKKLLTVLVGPTAGGKSTLLQSILGETVSISGHTIRNFHQAAYCPQTPWLMAGTIRDNIIGASSIDEDWYIAVIQACGLAQDIESWIDGDRTQVGNNGSSLSGGQRQRVSLARAMYSRNDFVLIDDILSGIDAQTSRLIIDRAFGPYGLFRRYSMTVVVATHSRALISCADRVIVVDQGTATPISRPSALEADAIGAGRSEKEPLAESRPSVASQVQSARSSPSLQGESVDRKRQRGDFSVYGYYTKAAGRWHVAVFLVLMMLWSFCQNFSTVWLDLWSDADSNGSGSNDTYLGVYVALGVASTICMIAACWVLFIRMITKSMRNLHTSLLWTVLRAPISFFQETDLGSLTNRFSQDMTLIGMDFPVQAVNYVSAITECLVQVVILAVFAKYLAVATPFVLILVFLIQRYYLRTSRQIRLLDIEAKAPLFRQFLETTAGASSIRAFRWQRHFQHNLDALLDRSQRPVYLLYCVQQWLALVLDLIVAALAVLLVAIVVNWRTSFNAGSVGVALLMILTFNKTLMLLVKYWTLLETSVGAVSRIKTFVETTPPEYTGPADDGAEASDWPSSGAIEIEKLVASYSIRGPQVLRGVTLNIKPGEKVAICGRSGSGKSSLIMSLLRMTFTQNGSIVIDGRDALQMDPNLVRQGINVVPQEPVLLPGTIRFNLDPYLAATDNAVVEALKAVKLWSRIGRVEKLDEHVDLAAWSVGERQLLCLARSIVRGGNVLLLDEATSSVDHGTERIMQDAIDSRFTGVTVISVLHRLDSIQTYDKVAVLDGGSLVEYDDPRALLKQDSKLADLLKTTNPAKK